MAKLEIIKKIEENRGSKVITYVTNDRPGPMNGRVAMDIIPIVNEQLNKIGKVDKIDLFLYTTGGDTMVPWRLVSMIREHCNTFSVLIPYKAHSAGSMIALGADEIVMTNLSEISPIDPSTSNIFNPSDPTNPQNKIPISVEDVIAYFDLAKNKFGIKNDEDLTKIFNKFVEANPQIHPLSLGNINRTHNLIRLIAKRLLKSHKNKMREGEIDKIVEFFTEKLYSHTYFIGRREAKEELGVKSVVEADEDLTKLISELFSEYYSEMNLGNSVWNPDGELGASNQKKQNDYKVAFVESLENQKYYNLSIEFTRQQVTVNNGSVQTPQNQVGFRVINQGWK
ncbi:MAG: hypothetical protein WC089_00895 [Candidatus Paceibacterota bacterium]